MTNNQFAGAAAALALAGLVVFALKTYATDPPALTVAKQARLQAICSSAEMGSAISSTSIFVGQANRDFAPSSLKPGIDMVLARMTPAGAVEWDRVNTATIKVAQTFKGLDMPARDQAVSAFATKVCLEGG